jgi:hypothetical protein
MIPQCRSKLHLILELAHPYQGFIRISNAPLHNARALLGQWPSFKIESWHR